MKELFTHDTVINQYHSVFDREPEDKKFGYLFTVSLRSKTDNYIDWYNGQRVMHIIPKDSTYAIQEDATINMQTTLPGYLQWIKSRMDKSSFKLVQTRDTIIDAVQSYHLIAAVWDTIIDKKRNYTDVDIFIDKAIGIPDMVVTKAISTTFGDGTSTYYSEIRYFNYKINQSSVNLTANVLPQGFQPLKDETNSPKEHPELLPEGCIAPDWTLYNSEGEKMSLAQLKGKVVLMDFFFIGCGSCMEALKPLNKLHEKYRNQNIVVVSMTFRDDKKSTAWFKKNYNIRYPIYINAGEVVEAYKVEAFPTFYFIDKEGRIANSFVGYAADFETKATSTIDKLLTE